MKNIYLDHQSSTPLEPRVFEFIKGFLNVEFGNPSSQHSVGLRAREALEDARQKVAALINAADPGSVIFTGSATEANNLAVKGAALRNHKKMGKEVVASSIEHMSVLNPVKELGKSGFGTGLVPVDSTGLIDLAKLEEIVTENTVVTSIMMGNNEIGTLQPVEEAAAIVHARDSYIHVDATAAAGRVPVDVQASGIDLLTLSSVDMYGPRGAGALYVRPGVKLQSILPGGGQEKGLRSGTENIFAIAGMGEAARIAALEMESESARLTKMRDELISGLMGIEETYLTGHPEKRLPNHVSVRFTAIEGEGILLLMDKAGMQVSTGSACSSQTLQASHVLLATGLKHEEVHGSMVLTLGRSNVIEDVPYIVDTARETVERLRRMSPVWNTRK